MYLADCVIDVLLEASLDLYMPLGINVVSTAEHAFDVLGDLIDVSDGARLDDLVQKLHGPDSTLLEGFLEEVVAVIVEGQSTKDVGLVISPRENWFDTASDSWSQSHRQRACGRDTREEGVASLVVSLGVDREFPGREDALLSSQVAGSLHSNLLNKTHYRVNLIETLLAVVSDAPLEQILCEAHNTETAATSLASHLLNSSHRDVECVDDVVQHADAHRDSLAQLLYVAGSVLVHHSRHVDGAQVADVSVVEELLTARIARLDTAQLWQRVSLVDFVQEHTAWLSVAPRSLHNFIKQLVGGHVDVLDLVLGAAISITGDAAQRVGHSVELSLPGARVLVLDLLHKLVGQADRDVEVPDGSFLGLDVDEFEDIRVVHTHHCHVCTYKKLDKCIEKQGNHTMSLLLLDDPEGRVVDMQEADWSRGFTTRGHSTGSHRAHEMQGEPKAAACFL